MTSPFLLASWILILCAMAVSWQAGSRSDRKAIACIALATLCSGFAYSHLAIGQALFANFLIDACLLLGITAYALRSGRCWPVWFAGFHGATVVFELVSYFLPEGARMISWRVGSFWFIPAFVAMTAGIYLDRRMWEANAPK